MTVSVVIPCYNAASYVAQTIGSVLEQTHPPDEIIVVDDGSTDESVELIRRFDDRVQLLTGPNAGAQVARNKGFAHATGDALMFLDADDVLGPTALDALTEALAQRPSGVAACPWYRLEEEGGGWVRRPPSCASRQPGQDPLEAWLAGWYHPPCSVLWSRRAFEAVGPWEESLIVNQDGHLMMQALAQGIPLVLAERGEAFYRRLPADTPSVSGRRLTHEGLRAKLWVLESLAQTLAERSELQGYRSALDGALERLAFEAGERESAVASEVVAVARRYAGYPWTRTVRRVRRRAAAEAQRLNRFLRTSPRG